MDEGHDHAIDTGSATFGLGALAPVLPGPGEIMVSRANAYHELFARPFVRRRLLLDS